MYENKKVARHMTLSNELGLAPGSFRTMTGCMLKAESEQTLSGCLDECDVHTSEQRVLAEAANLILRLGEQDLGNEANLIDEVDLGDEVVIHTPNAVEFCQMLADMIEGDDSAEAVRECYGDLGSTAAAKEFAALAAKKTHTA